MSSRTRLALRALLCAAAAGLPFTAPAAGLGYAEAMALARDGAPGVRAQRSSVDGARAALVAADTLPDPRLTVGLDNVPVNGPDRWTTTRDAGTMQRLSLMQEVPNRAKREARVAMGQARVERERAMLAATAVMAQRDAALAWLGTYYAEQRRALVADFQRENRLLQDTLVARIASPMGAMPADMTMARQEALMIADRGDTLAGEVAKARAELRRWVGERAAEPLAGAPALPVVDAAALRARVAEAPELQPYAPMRAMASAEAAEMDAERRGDWGWEVVLNRRPRYDDMVSLMLTFDLPWQAGRRQQPLADEKRRAADRIEAEREELARRLAAEVDAMLAELAAMDAMHARLAGTGTQLAAERVALLTAGYQAGRNDLGAVLAARTQAVETRMKVIELEGQRAAMRVRLAAMVGALGQDATGVTP
ncbi:MAG TPA: TolC family protein [Burkholderiaceae bacterium]|nr:TolC family protein [Burkholderiaceae bacterium]